jgi:hypothetical protein
MFQKIYGWTLIIFCGGVSIMLIAIVPGVLQRFDFANLSLYLAVSCTLFLTFLAYLVVTGFLRGIKKIRTYAYDQDTTEFTDTLNLSLSGRISLSDYRNNMLAMAFMRPWYIFVTLVAATAILNFIINDNNGIDVSYLFFITVFLLVPLFSIAQLHKNYNSNKALNSHLTYNLNNTSLIIDGESVNAILYWNHFHKVKETRNFFLLYQGEGIATFIDKKLFTKSELVTFRRFLKSLSLRRI